MIKKFSDLSIELDALREKGIVRGEATGFKSLDALYSVKQGSYTFILGAPGHGKSEITFEILLNQSIRYGKRHMIYSPETGNPAEILAELIHKHTTKSVFKTRSYHCEDREYYSAINWIEQHFLIVDSDDRAYTIPELFEMALKWEKEHPGETIHTIMAEPWNEIRHNMEGYGGRQDLYIEDIMGEVRRFCKKNNKHMFLTIHPAHQQIKEVDGKRFYPMPLAREAAGGQALLRKAMTWINIWRPPIGILNENGQPFQENEVLVLVEKAKPKGVSEKGMISLFFDFLKNRYYEVYEGNKLYAFEHEKIRVERLIDSSDININPSPLISEVSQLF